MSHEVPLAPEPLSHQVWRGATLRCPKCGKSPLFRAYLKPVETCACCGEAFGHIRADDGPAWLTILVVGHIVVWLVLVLEPQLSWPEWAPMVVWPGLALALVLTLLPSAKGIFIALIWRSKGPGSEREA